jgi:hypothetical protein
MLLFGFNECILAWNKKKQSGVNLNQRIFHKRSMGMLFFLSEITPLGWIIDNSTRILPRAQPHHTALFEQHSFPCLTHRRIFDRSPNTG